MNDQTTPSSPNNESSKGGKSDNSDGGLWLGVQLAWDLGWIIAIPVVVLGLGGAYLDKYLGTSPLFILLGFILAVSLSFIGVKRKTKEIMKKRF